MIQLEVKTNSSSIVAAAKPFTVTYAARISASTLGAAACLDTFKTCCDTTWVTDGAAQSVYIDYSDVGTNYATSKAKVFFALDGGFESYRCYRVAVTANAFTIENGDKGPLSSSTTGPEYVTWFTTDSVAPSITGATFSSEDAASPFARVARTAYIT